MLTKETLLFIKTHANDNPQTLAFQAGKYPAVDMPSAITQIAGKQSIAEKIPSWHNAEGVLFPKHLSLEQCSSELTARYKASLIKGESFIDLTGGFGIDCAFISANFQRAIYIERQTELCEIAENNFPLLGLRHIIVKNEDSVSYLKETGKVNCIFIDPARRNEQGGKTVAISDCEPDVRELASLLLSKADSVMIKLSPMLDLTLALHDMPNTKEVHVISVANECKELLLLLDKQQQSEKSIYCVNINKNGRIQHFRFSREQEQSAVCEYAAEVSKYLYEPNASILKAGAYKSISAIYKVRKLHPNSHLYTSDTLVPDFPGRVFQCESTFSLNKKELKEELDKIKKANITVRNFPASVAELRKRTKLGDGGDLYLFATTLSDERKVIIKCVKA